MRWRAFTFTALMSSLAACSLFTELGGLDHPPESDGGTSDANASSSSGSSSGGGDGSIQPGDEGGVDGGDASPDGAQPFCQSATGLAFCADFDSVAAPEDGWTKPYGGLALTLDATRRVSPLYALKVQAPALDAGANAQGALEITLNGSPSQITATADLYVEDPKPTGGGLVVLFALYLATDYDVYIEIDPTQTVLMEKLAGNTTSYQSHVITPFPLDTWVHLELVYNTAGGAKLTVRRTVSGAAVQETTLAMALASGATAGTYGIRAGLPYAAGTTSATTVWTDNVTLASKP